MSAPSKVDESHVFAAAEGLVSTGGGLLPDVGQVTGQEEQLRELEKTLQHLDVPVVTLPPAGGTAEYSFPSNWPSTPSEGHRPSLDSGANVGYAAVLNSRIAVVDVDTKNGGCPDQVRTDLESAEVRIYMEVITPSGGRHFWCEGHKNLPNRQFGEGAHLEGALWQGVDVLTRGKLVFLPGSTRFRPEYKGMGYRIVYNRLAELARPRGDGLKLLKLLNAVSQKQREGVAADVPRVTRNTDYRDLVALVRDQEEGARNESLYKIVLRYLQYGPDHPAWSTIRGEFVQAALDAGLSTNETESTIGSAEKKAGARESKAELVDGIEADHLRDRVFTPEELAFRGRVEPLVGNILYRDTLAQISGPPGSYKSFLAVALACAVASGRSVGHHCVSRPGNVLYIAAEGASGMHDRVRAWCEHNDADYQEVGSRLKFLEGAVDLTVSRQREQLRELIEEHDLSLVIVDTRALCTPGADENSATEQGEIISGLEAMRRFTGCGVLVVHHSSKSASGGRGSNAWDAAVWTDLRVTGKALLLSLNVHKHKDAPAGMNYLIALRPVVVGDGPTRTLVLTGIQPEGSQVLNSTQQKILECLRKNDSREGMSRKQIVELLEPLGVKQSTVYENVKGLVGANIVEIVIAAGGGQAVKLVDERME